MYTDSSRGKDQTEKAEKLSKWLWTDFWCSRAARSEEKCAGKDLLC